MSDYLLKIRSTADLAGLQSAQRGVNALGEKVRSSFSGLTGILAGSAITAGVKSILSYADHIQDLADRAKSGAADLQRLAAATKESGVEIDQLSQSLGKLSLFQAKVAAGDKDSLALIADMKLDAAAVAKASRVDLFYSLADSFSEIKNPADQAKASVMLFGEQGLSLIPVLEQGRQALLDMGNAATVMSDQTVGELAKVNSELEKGIANMKAFGATALAAAMNKVASVGVAIGAAVEQERIQQEYNDSVAAINRQRDAALDPTRTREKVRQEAMAAALQGQLGFEDPSGGNLEAAQKAADDAAAAFDKAQTLTKEAAAARLQSAKTIRDQALQNLFKVTEANFQNPLGVSDGPGGSATPGSPTGGDGPAAPRSSPLDNPPKPETLKDRITSIGGIIGANTNAVSYLSRTATATERSATALEKVASELGTGRPATSVFSS